MWSMPSTATGTSGSARARNTTAAARDTSGKGWESVNLFHSYSAPQGYPLQGAQLQHEQQLRPLPFPDSVSPAALTASPAAVLGDTRVTTRSDTSRLLDEATRGVSSSPSGPWVFPPSTSVGTTREHVHQRVHERPSPWQRSSAFPPIVVSLPATFASNCTELSQPGRIAAVSNAYGRYFDGPHALYRAARVPAPFMQAPRLQPAGRVPQDTKFQTPPQFSAKPSPPSGPPCPPKASRSDISTDGTRAKCDTISGASRASCRPSPFVAGVADSAAPRIVFPDTIALDAATPREKQSSKGPAASPADFVEGGSWQESPSPGQRAKIELLEGFPARGSVDETNQCVPGKPDTLPGVHGETQPCVQRDSRSAQNGTRQDAAQEPAVSASLAGEESSHNPTPDGIRQRFVRAAQQQQTHPQQPSTQGRQQQHMIWDPAGGTSNVTRPKWPIDPIRGKSSLYVRIARLYHEALQVLQLDACDLVPVDDLPYLGPFDLMCSDLSQDIQISGELALSNSGSGPDKAAGRVDKVYMEQSRPISTTCGRSTSGYGNIDACGIQRIFEKLYAQAGSHLEQLRFRRLYSPAMAGTSALCCLTCLLFFCFTVSQKFVRYVLFKWSSTTSSASEARALLTPHSFAVGLLSIGASACVFLAAIFLFFFFQQHLRMSHLNHKINLGNRTMSAPGAASQRKYCSPHHTGRTSIYTKDGAPTATQRIEVSLGEEYSRLYTMCARGDVVAGRTHAVETADVAVKYYLDASKQDVTETEARRQSDRGEARANKRESLPSTGREPRSMPAAEAEGKGDTATTVTEGFSPSSLTSGDDAVPHTVRRSETGHSEQRPQDEATFIQDVTDRNLIAYTTFQKGVEAGAGIEDEAALVTAADVGLRNYFLRSMWLTFGCAVTAAVARMVLSLLLSHVVIPGLPPQWTQEQQRSGATLASRNVPRTPSQDLFVPAHTPPPPSSWLERFKAEWHQRGDAALFLPRIRSVDANGPGIPHLPTTAMAQTDTSVLGALWIALSRLATFQMQAAGFMFLSQFVAVALILQPREELRLTPVVARTAAFLQLAIGIIELFCTGVNGLTLILGDVALKEIVLLMVHLAGQRLVQLSRENFAAKITYRSRLPATSTTAAAAGALLASACSARGAAAAESVLAERRKRLRWGTSSILRSPPKTAHKNSSPEQ